MVFVVWCLAVVSTVLLGLWVFAGVVRLVDRGARPRARRRGLNQKEVDRLSEAWRRERERDDDREDGA